MNKLVAFCALLFLTGTAQLSTAQLNTNKIQITPGAENSSPNFINGISFTPDGILQTTESGGSKSVKIEAAPVVVKENEASMVADAKSASLIEKLSTLQYKYAMMLDVDIESLQNLSLFGYIDNWFGTKYRLGGSTKSGIDCSALTSSLLLAVYGFAVPRTARQQYKSTQHIKKSELKEGDLVFFNTHGGVSHVGLYLDNDYFVHASSSQGVTISCLDDRYYAKRFICGGRVEEN
ncbi:MAG: C40 family peptidase [Bacteroidota bacterium]|nr:C40 family peptidase [Bacteroidota bacterium]